MPSIVNHTYLIVDISASFFYTSSIALQDNCAHILPHLLERSPYYLLYSINTTNTTNAAGKSSPRRLVLIAMMTAITCILAPLSIPIPVSPVPISLTNLVLLISVYILGWKDASISFIIYLLLGLAGLPVFSGFSGGLGKIAGPTGGYLAGFIFMTVIAGLAVDIFSGKRLPAVIGMALGTAVAYAFGTAWLAIQMDLTFISALSIGVLPYLAGDTLKIILAVSAGPMLKKRLRPLNF